ncbi:MAG: hypothetical protein A2X94_01565 [Bdellovibrionales bacterium GWB1_55_8]|nr:MAG: hypothetical protein A2X94_01565 [Bdellovibrionales bacterium GWB1_55_8]
MWIGIAGAAGNALPAFASQSETFTIDSNSEHSLSLSGVQEHDVYQEVLVPRTCSRQVFGHYETVCHTVSHRVCHNDRRGHRICRESPRRECHQVARYYTEFYDCSYTTTVKVGTETDYYVNASINVKVTAPEGAVPHETLRASIDRHSGTVDFSAARTSGEFLVFVKESAETQVNGKQKSVQVQAEVTLVPTAGIRKAFRTGISSVDFKSGVLSFEMPTHVFSKEVQLSLTVKRQRTLWFSKKLFSGQISASALEVAEGTETSRYTLDLAKLGMKEALKNEKNYKLQIKLEPSHSALSGCLNRHDLGEEGSTELNLKKQKI